jgi:glycosyltransferase involved in cell wall biosynthesis
MAVKPLVSVVMPAYNAARYIDCAIKSILSQTYKKLEFIIIEDGSKDETFHLIKKYKDKRIRLIKNNKNVGVIESLNRGVKLASGKYVVRMDADDWSYPRRIETQVRLMESHPKIVVSGSYIEICDSNLRVQHLRKYKLTDKEIRQRLFRYSPFAHPATIWRTKDLKIEGYDRSALNVEDYELYFRIGRHGEFRNINKSLLKLRMHNKSISYSANDKQSEFTIKIRKDASRLYGYKMTTFDLIYNFLQSTIVRLIPINFRFKIFNLLRKIDIY